MSELKFDRARFDAGEMPTRTRDGSKVLHVHDSGLDVERPIVAWIEGCDAPDDYTSGGVFSWQGPGSGFDLVHGPKMRKVRVAIALSADGSLFYMSDQQSDADFDSMKSSMEREGRLLKVIEVEVPE